MTNIERYGLKTKILENKEDSVVNNHVNEINKIRTLFRKDGTGKILAQSVRFVCCRARIVCDDES